MSPPPFRVFGTRFAGRLRTHSHWTRLCSSLKIEFIFQLQELAPLHFQCWLVGVRVESTDLTACE
jgi:hypothetical protein